MILEQLKTLTAKELRGVIAEAKALLKRPKLYIREIAKPSAGGRIIYLYATWQEDGKTKQKSLGSKKTETTESLHSEIEHDFRRYGIDDLESIKFLESMVTQGYFIAN
ncbi:MAG: hypothetical protein AAF702_18120 [Chloroflexota bacterium]